MINLKYYIENINNIDSLYEDYKVIKSKKKIAIDKIKNIDDKKRSILGELLLIKGLHDYYNINYKDIDIQLNINGKPYINDKDYFHIKFNISHSHDYSICAFSNKEIGVDIEKIRMININIMKQFATPNEIEYIMSSENQKLKRLMKIVVFKKKENLIIGK